MRNDIINFLQDEINENNISHAFLIETNDIKELEKDIEELLYKNKIIDTVDNEKSITHTVINAENNLIDKNKIIDIQKFIMTKSINYDYKVYFINNAELMNLSSANKLLKMLEEPSDNIIGFLLTTNTNAIIPTIKSRCKHFKKMYSIDPMDINEDLVNSIDNIKNLNYLNIIDLKKSLLSIDKKELMDTLLYYKEKLLSTLPSSTNINSLANIYKIVDNSIDLLKSNVNTELVLDKLFIELRK